MITYHSRPRAHTKFRGGAAISSCLRRGGKDGKFCLVRSQGGRCRFAAAPQFASPPTMPLRQPAAHMNCADPGAVCQLLEFKSTGYVGKPFRREETNGCVGATIIAHRLQQTRPARCAISCLSRSRDAISACVFPSRFAASRCWWHDGFRAAQDSLHVDCPTDSSPVRARSQRHQEGSKRHGRHVQLISTE